METTSTSVRSSDRMLSENLRQLCDLHNAMRGNLQGYDCPECRNKGWIYRMDGMREVARKCACMQVRDSIRRMKRSGLYDKLRTQTFAAYVADEPWQKHLLKMAQRYAERRDAPAFFIGGQQGAGKTHLCTAICASLLEQGLEVQYFVWETYVKEILFRSGVSDRLERDALMQPLMQSPVVCLDDFLRRDEPTQSERGVAFDVINRRYTEGKLTIISSEHTINGLMQTDQAVAGRIREMCGGTYCLCIEHDIKKNYRMRRS